MSADVLAVLRAQAARVTGMFRDIIGPSTAVVGAALGPPTEVIRELDEQRAAAEETAKALAALPKRTLRKLTVVTVRCPGNEVLVRVVRIPAWMPGAAYDDRLVVPGPRADYRDHPGHPQRPWFAEEHDLSYRLRCRCHRDPFTLTPGQLLGESPPPLGIRVLQC